MSNYSNEAEQAILGAVLSGQVRPSDCNLRYDHFHAGHHQALWEICTELDDANVQPDFITVASRIPDDHPLADSNGVEYITSLAEDSIHVTESMAQSYSDIVRNCWAARMVSDKSLTVADEVTQHNVDEKLAVLDTLSDEITGNVSELAKPNKQAIKETLSELDARSRDPDSMRGVQTGLTALDKMLLGMQGGDMVVLAARPSQGKTALALNFVANACEAGNRTVVFSIEMPATKLYERMMAAGGLIDYKAVRTGSMEPIHWEKLTPVISRMHGYELRIDDRPTINPSQMRAACRRYRRDMGGLDFIVIDYLQLVQLGRKAENRTQEIRQVSRAIKSMAKEFDVPVLVLSQLNRGVENRPDKRPKNSDLRESGDIEQDADVIMFIYRDEVYHPDTTEAGVAEIIIGKAREGEIGKVHTSWQGQYQKFMDLMPGYDYE